MGFHLFKRIHEKGSAATLMSSFERYYTRESPLHDIADLQV